MSRSLVLSLFCLACVASTTLALPFAVKTDNLPMFKDLPQGAKIIPFLSIFGDREEGDKLVLQESVEKTFDTLQNVTLTVAYPEGGVRAITYAEVIVMPVGRVEVNVLSGGIGEKEISFRIEEYQTYNFNVSCKIYGK